MKEPWFRLLDAVIPFTILVFPILQVLGSLYQLTRIVGKSYGDSYDFKVWSITILYLLAILFIDLYLVYGKDLLPVRAIRNTWGAAALILLAGLAGIRPKSLLGIVLLMSVTPLALLQPLTDPLPDTVNWAVALIFCAVNGLLCHLISRRRK